jgi:hypothetical protein
MSAPFDTANGEKQACREAFVRAVHEHIPRPADFFLLPSENAHDAVLIWEHWPNARIVGVEKDAYIFDRIRTEHRRLNIHNSSVGGYVRTMAVNRDRELKPLRFDAAFLDYMGAAMPSDIADVCNFAAEMSAPRFILALTFAKSARGGGDTVERLIRTKAMLTEEEQYDEGARFNTAENLANAICQAIDRGQSIKGHAPTKAMAGELRRLDLLEARTYRARRNSSEMHFVILHIERFQ